MSSSRRTFLAVSAGAAAAALADERYALPWALDTSAGMKVREFNFTSLSDAV